MSGPPPFTCVGQWPEERERANPRDPESASSPSRGERGPAASGEEAALPLAQGVLVARRYSYRPRATSCLGGVCESRKCSQSLGTRFMIGSSRERVVAETKLGRHQLCRTKPGRKHRNSLRPLQCGELQVAGDFGGEREWTAARQPMRATARVGAAGVFYDVRAARRDGSSTRCAIPAGPRPPRGRGGDGDAGCERGPPHPLHARSLTRATPLSQALRLRCRNRCERRNASAARAPAD